MWKAADVVEGHVFDNNILCIAEKEVFVVESVAGVENELEIRWFPTRVRNGCYSDTVIRICMQLEICQ